MKKRNLEIFEEQTDEQLVRFFRINFMIRPANKRS
jgi:hypothetical protein